MTIGELRNIINENKGTFTGVIDVSSGFDIYYDDYITGATVNLSLSSIRRKGSVATVRIKADLTGSIPSDWNKSGAPITNNPAKVNEITILYVNDSDIRLVNRVVAFADVTPPSVPSNLSYSLLTSVSVTLSWDASTDDVIVASYNVYKDGVLAKNVPATPSPSTSISGLTETTTYAFTVSALDGAGNQSAQSSSLSVTTPADSSVTAEYTAMLNYAIANSLTLPSSDQQVIDNQMIVSLKAEGIWNEIDVLHYFQATYTPTGWADNFYRMNWKDPSKFFLGADSGRQPLWVSGSGFKSTFVSGNWQFAKTGFIPSSDAVKFGVNDCSLIFSLFDCDTTAPGPFVYGGRTSGTVPHNYVGNTVINQMSFRINAQTGAVWNITQADINSHYHGYYDGTNAKVFINGATELTVSTAPVTRGLATVEQYLFAWNNNGSAQLGTKNNGIKYMIVGSNLATKKLEIFNILNP